jgi:hypothetical protein
MGHTTRDAEKWLTNRTEDILHEPDTFWNSLLHDTVLQQLQVHKSPILSHNYQLQKSTYFDKSEILRYRESVREREFTDCMSLYHPVYECWALQTVSHLNHDFWTALRGSKRGQYHSSKSWSKQESQLVLTEHVNSSILMNYETLRFLLFTYFTCVCVSLFCWSVCREPDHATTSSICWSIVVIVILPKEFAGLQQNLDCNFASGFQWLACVRGNLVLFIMFQFVECIYFLMTNVWNGVLCDVMKAGAMWGYWLFASLCGWWHSQKKDCREALAGVLLRSFTVVGSQVAKGNWDHMLSQSWYSCRISLQCFLYVMSFSLVWTMWAICNTAQFDKKFAHSWTNPRYPDFKH